MIIKEGADVNEKNSDNKTPLSLAIRRQKQEIVSMLIAYGADVNEKIADISPRELALKLDRADVNEKIADIYPLELALKLDRNDIIDTLIDNGGFLKEGDDSRLSDEQNVKTEHNYITFNAFYRSAGEDFSHFKDLGNDATINQDYFIRLCEKDGIPAMKKTYFQNTLGKIQEKNNKIYSSLDEIYTTLEPIINEELNKSDTQRYPSLATVQIILQQKATTESSKSIQAFNDHRSKFSKHFFNQKKIINFY